MKTLILNIFLAVALTSGGTWAIAAEIPWRTKMYRFNAKEPMKLKEFLRDFTASQSVTAVIDDKIEGVVKGLFELPPSGVLPVLANTYGLIWYFDGSLLHIYPASEARSEVLHMSYANMENLQRTMARLGIADKRYPLAYDKEQNTALVSGPKRYVELVQNAARSLDQNEILRANTEVRVFLLKHAWAADFSFVQSGKEVTVPGVASTLRKLFGPARKELDPQEASRKSVQSSVKLKRYDLDFDTLTKSSSGEGNDGASSGGGTPQFQADSRLNALLVRDLPDRMQRYADLIKALDVRSGLVEIEVTIMDVSTDFIEELGLDWRFHSRQVDLQIGRGNSPSPNFGTAVNETSPPNDLTPRGALLTAIGGNAGRYLIGRVRAQAENGKANFVARPKIMTLDNTQAILENLSEFYVRVAGNQDVGLFNITAGTSLRVTPLIVNDGDARGVKMNIKIEDGSLSDARVDQIPVVRRRTVNTQAFVNEGESLLIAGYTVEEDNNGDIGVPGLSRLPLVGNLFKYSQVKRSKSERLYMLTPRVATPSGVAAAASIGGGSAPVKTSLDANGTKPVDAVPLDATNKSLPASSPSSAELNKR